MGSVWLRLRAELRGQWRGCRPGGAARRDRRHRADRRRGRGAPIRSPLPAPEPRRRPDGAATLSGFDGYFRAIARLPQVSSSASAAFLQMSLPARVPAVLRPGGRSGPAGGEGLSLDRVKVLAGRLFDPADPHAVMISQQVADREHLRPGGTLYLIGTRSETATLTSNMRCGWHSGCRRWWPSMTRSWQPLIRGCR
jgi:hypothetical protein